MKAYQLREFGIEKLRAEDEAVPSPRFGEVLIKFKAAALNYRDLMIVNGTYNPRMELPSVPLSDGAGEIAEVGEGVEEWSVGDRVSPIVIQQWLDGQLTEVSRRSALGGGSKWNGVAREFGCFPAESIVRIPEHLSYLEAATLPCAGLTAWNALKVSGAVKADEEVLTLGTGGVSVFALQFAKLAGAVVTITSSSDAKLERASELGADRVINYRQSESWDREVLNQTSKRGVDHVVEVGGAGTLSRSINAVKVGGHVAMIGALSDVGSFNPIPLFMKAVRLQGIFVGSRQMFLEMNAAIETSKLRPVIDRVFSFGDVRHAFEYMRSGSHFGKVVINFEE